MWRAAALLFAMTTASTGAMAFDLALESRIKGQSERLSFSHDASPSNPMFGNPTSVLEYTPANSLWAELALSGRSVENTGLWFDLSASIPLTGGGSFADYDYYAGQVLFSDTRSSVALGQGIVGSLRLPVPFINGIASGGITLRPYFTGNGERRQLSATGLACGTVCGALPAVADNTAVIGHELTGWQVGAGLWLEAILSDVQTLDIRAEFLGGHLHANDTHHLRSNLGPAPHIAYDFATIGAQVEVTYTHALSEKLAVTASGLGFLRHGNGRATFGASLPSPIGAFNAGFDQLSGALAVGLKASF